MRRNSKEAVGRRRLLQLGKSLELLHLGPKVRESATEVGRCSAEASRPVYWGGVEPKAYGHPDKCPVVGGKMLRPGDETSPSRPSHGIGARPQKGRLRVLYDAMFLYGACCLLSVCLILSLLINPYPIVKEPKDPSDSSEQRSRPK